MSNNRTIYLLTEPAKNNFLKFEQEIMKEYPLINTKKCNVYGASHILFSDELKLPKEFDEDTLNSYRNYLNERLIQRTFNMWLGSYMFNWSTGNAIIILNDFTNRDENEQKGNLLHEGKHIYLLRKIRRNRCNYTTYDSCLGEVNSFAGECGTPFLPPYEKEGIPIDELVSLLNLANDATKKYPVGIVDVITKDAMINGKTKEKQRMLFRDSLLGYGESINYFYESLLQ